MSRLNEQAGRDFGVVAEEEIIFDSNLCRQILGKGQKAAPEKGQMISDVGDFRGIKIPEGKGALTKEEVEDLYRQTIAAGVIDHHFIDSATIGRLPKGVELKCATKMVADFAPEVKALLEKKKVGGESVTTTVTHFDSDLDALSSSFLLQSLIQKGKLPAGAEKIADFVNEVDYGRFSEADPKKYLESLSGLFGALKSKLGERADQELSKDVFGNPAMKDPVTKRLNGEGVQAMNAIRAKYEQLVGKYTFELLNVISNAAYLDADFDPKTEMPRIESELSAELRGLLDGDNGASGGKEMVRESFEKFNQDFEQATRRTMKVKNLISGESAEMPVIVALEPSVGPLVFTNMAYQRTAPDTIVAVYGGPKRRPGTGDMYDIGITPDAAKLIDLSALCVALNKAEKAKREAILDKAESDRSPEEQALAKKWAGLPDRLGMSGPEQVLTKDPTVLVAGGSLVAASNTSLLSPEDFVAVIESLEK